MLSLRIRQAMVIGTVVAGLTALTPNLASAGIYTWKYYATYSTAAECQQAGASLISSGQAENYRCEGTSGADLYLAHNW